MKKFVKLSLAAAVATAGLTSVASANTLAEAFAASKASGEIKAMYFTKEKTNGVQADISVVGGNLNITTGDFNGLSATASFQTSHVLSVDDTNSVTADNNLYGADMNAQGSVLSQSFLTYKANNTTANLGRQYISTKLVASSGSRMIKDSFEAITVVNTDLPNTTLVAGYVDKYQARVNDTENEPGEFDQYKDGAYTVVVSNKSVEKLALLGQYVIIQDYSVNDAKIGYVEAEYDLGVAKVAGQYLTSDNGDATNSDGSAIGIRLSAKISNIALTAAYTTSSDDKATVLRGAGEGAYPLFTSAGMIAAGAEAYDSGTDAFLVSASTTISGLKAGIVYGSYDSATTGQDYNETNLNASYSFAKNLNAAVSYSFFGKDYAYDNRVRTYLTYKF